MNNNLYSKKYTILVADDDVDDLEFIKTIFENHTSFDVLACVDNGKKLIDYVQNTMQKPDIIITDIYMPLMSGTQAIEILLSDIPNFTCQIIVLSTTIIPSLIDQFKEYGNIEFIKKPTTLAHYESLPEKILEIMRYVSTDKC